MEGKMFNHTTELVKEQDKWHRRYNDALIEIAKLTAENTNLECAIKKLIQERDCAIEDINRNASLTASDDPYYLALGKNAQGETEYISVTIKTKDGNYKEIWRGVRR